MHALDKMSTDQGHRALTAELAHGCLLDVTACTRQTQTKHTECHLDVTPNSAPFYHSLPIRILIPLPALSLLPCSPLTPPPLTISPSLSQPVPVPSVISSPFGFVSLCPCHPSSRAPLPSTLPTYPSSLSYMPHPQHRRIHHVQTKCQ